MSKPPIPFQRAQASELARRLAKPRRFIQVVAGARQVGKTTMVQQVVEDTLQYPQAVIQSLSDEQARLYYRLYVSTIVGDKYLCVVVMEGAADAFVVTAYLTDKVKKGEQLWPKGK